MSQSDAMYLFGGGRFDPVLGFVLQSETNDFFAELILLKSFKPRFQITYKFIPSFTSLGGLKIVVIQQPSQD